MNYVDTIGRSFPTVAVSCVGTPEVYEDLIWESGDPLPSQDELYQAYVANQQNDIWLAIKAERDARKAGGIMLPVNGTNYWFWTDDPSRAEYAMLNSTIARHQLPDNYIIDQWKTMDGSFVPFPVSLLHTVIDMGIQNESVVFSVAEAHRKAMLALSDPTGYDFTTGWPMSYYDTLTASP